MKLILGVSPNPHLSREGRVLMTYFARDPGKPSLASLTQCQGLALMSSPSVLNTSRMFNSDITHVGVLGDSELEHSGGGGGTQGF